jgi:hypothetical protein
MIWMTKILIIGSCSGLDEDGLANFSRVQLPNEFKNIVE